MKYDMDNPQRGIRDCPRCHRTMEHLRTFLAIDRQEGYLLDDGTDNYQHTYMWGGWKAALVHYLYRQVIEPLMYLVFGRLIQKRYARIVVQFPNTLRCPHCHYLLKHK